jgi:glycerol-3-phosphate O-acyltransferase/dihydroxyacetone phosphate acyltransferase
VPGAPESLPASANAGARPRLDALVAALARLLVRIFFRQVEVVGAARLPASGPLVVVANHQNGMIDPLLIVAALPSRGRMPRFLATHLLWRNPALRPWLALGGVIPVYRPKDVAAAADPGQNAAAFARCHEQLAAGGTVALFPEGTSHSEPGLAPLKTGAARIVLEAARRFPGLAPRIVPIGLTFEAKGTFRSRALLVVGEPIEAALEIAHDRQEAEEAARAGAAAAQAPAPASGPAAPAAPAVRALTARIDNGLQAVTLNYGSWEEARRIGRAAELFSRHAAPAGLPGEGPLAERFTLHRAFVEGYAELCRRDPERTAAAAEAIDRYDRMLGAFGLRDDQIAAAYPAIPVARWLGRTVLRLLIYLPLGVVGIALNWVPYRLVGEVAARATREPDMPASFKVFGGILLFPLAWLLEAAFAAELTARLAGRPSLAGAAAALVTLVVAPATGWVALRLDDRRGQLWREARAWLLLRSRRAVAAELRGRREAAAREVSALADLYLSLAGDEAAGASPSATSPG